MSRVSAVVKTRNTEALRARRRGEIRQRLLKAVERLYDEGQMYADISVERLIREAGVTRSTFYAYFADKDALLQDLAATVLDELVAHWTKLPLAPSHDELTGSIEQIVEAYLPHRAVMVAIGSPVPGSDARAKFETLFIERSAKRVAAFIRAAQAADTLDPELHPEITATLLMWMTERGLAKLIAPADDATRALMVQSLIEMYWRTLARDTR